MQILTQQHQHPRVFYPKVLYPKFWYAVEVCSEPVKGIFYRQSLQDNHKGYASVTTDADVSLIFIVL